MVDEQLKYLYLTVRTVGLIKRGPSVNSLSNSVSYLRWFEFADFLLFRIRN